MYIERNSPGTYWKSNTDCKIVGFTDSDGDDAANLDLSNAALQV